MKELVLVGDIHGKVREFLALIKPYLNKGNTIIQLGDFGFGFIKIEDLPEGVKLIRGNHDGPKEAREHKAYLGDYGTICNKKVFFLSGAFSIDWEWRIPGASWWPDEELSQQELQAAIDFYADRKPEIVLTHEAPASVIPLVLRNFMLRPYKKPCMDSRTSQALQAMLDIHQPKQWFFGHHHISCQYQVQNTAFRCLSELELTKIKL